MKLSTWLCAVLVAALVLTGPLASWQAFAQSPGDRTSIFIEAEPKEPTEGHRVGAGFVNAVYVPGKVILCTLGTFTAAGFLVATFGSAYPTAVRVFEEGCGGTWVVTPEHLSGKLPHDSEARDARW
jgi:hypothetical protein